MGMCLSKSDIYMDKMGSVKAILGSALLGLTKKVTNVRSDIFIPFVRPLGFVAHDPLLQLNNLFVSIGSFIIRS